MIRKGFIFFVVALLSLLPLGIAQAGGHADITVWVRNQTGGDLSLSLTNSEGAVSFFTLPAGVSELELVEGKYTYYASGLCGAQSGVWNLPTNRTLHIGCVNGVMDMSVVKKCVSGLYIYHDNGDTPPLFIPWDGYGKPLAGLAPWLNQQEFTDYWLMEWFLYTSYDWGCYNETTEVTYSGP